MEKNCYTCKWRNTNICNCKEMKKTFDIDIDNGNSSAYSEDGYLVEALRENLDTNEVIELIFEKLVEENFIKKSFLSKKLSGESVDDIELNLHELIDGALFKSIENFFSNKGAEKIYISDMNFSCKYWE